MLLLLVSPLFAGPSQGKVSTHRRVQISGASSPTPIPVPIANQTRGYDQGATGLFVRRFARAAPLPYRGLHAARRDETEDSLGELTRPLIPTQSSTASVSRWQAWRTARITVDLPSETPPLRVGSPSAASTIDQHPSRTVGAAMMACFRDLSISIGS